MFNYWKEARVSRTEQRERNKKRLCHFIWGLWISKRNLDFFQGTTEKPSIGFLEKEQHVQI